MYVSVYVCICMYICKYICVYVFMYMCVCVYVCSPPVQQKVGVLLLLEAADTLIAHTAKLQIASGQREQVLECCPLIGKYSLSSHIDGAKRYYLPLVTHSHRQRMTVEFQIMRRLHDTGSVGPLPGHQILDHAHEILHTLKVFERPRQ